MHTFNVQVTVTAIYVQWQPHARLKNVKLTPQIGGSFTLCLNRDLFTNWLSTMRGRGLWEKRHLHNYGKEKAL